MRNFFIYLCLFLMISFGGCAVHPVWETALPNTEPTQSVPVNRIDTTYFSLTVPESWLGDASWVIRENSDDGSYELRFSENQSAQDEYGGHLFTIRLIPEAEDYTYYPSYNPLGSIETAENGSFNVVVLYPTDVQFSMEAAALYMSMEKDIPDILNTITYHDCVFTDEPIPVPTHNTLT